MFFKIIMDKEIKIKNSIEQFDKWAVKYDSDYWMFYFRAAYKRILDVSKLFIKNNSNILDIGCGTGSFEKMLSENINYREIYGLDVSEEMLKIARYKNINKNINFINCDISQFDFNSNYFDAVFSLNSFHHFPNQDLVINKIYDLLKVNGNFIFLDLVKDNFLKNIWIGIVKKLCNEENVDFYSTDNLLSKLKEMGFKVVYNKSYLYFLRILVVKK